MKPLINLAYYFLIVVVVGLFSCEKDLDYSDKNIPPFANAGPDQTTFLPKDSVILDATNSNDIDGTISSYRWIKIDGPAFFTIENEFAAKTVVRSLIQGVYQFELNVIDNAGASAKDTVQIIVSSGDGTSQPPFANAGIDQTLSFPNDVCTLDGNGSYDPDGSITAFQWRKIFGPYSYNIQNPSSMQTIVNELCEGIYQFELIVTDNVGLIAKDTVQITVFPFITGCGISNRQLINVTLTQVGTLSEPRIPYTVASGGKIVFAGGAVIKGGGYFVSPAIDIYDVNSNVWATANFGEGREGIAAVSCGNKIFFTGGGYGDLGGLFHIAGNAVNIFDVMSGTWKSDSLSEARSYLTAGVVGNKVLFAGGLTDNDGPLSAKVDIYDLSTGTWSFAQLSSPRCCLTSVTVGDKVFFAGGYGYDYSTRVDIYNSTTNSWSTSELKGLAGPVSGVVVEDKIYWAGITRKGHNGEVEIWNTTTGEVSFDCLSYPRYAPAAFVKNNEIFFFSSSSEWNNEVDFVNNLRPQFDVYNISTNQWSIGILPLSVISPGIVYVNNKIYMGGGRDSRNSTTDKVYILNW